MMSAPASQASRISVGVKHPGVTGTPRSWQAAISAGRKTGLTMNWAPASMTRAAVSGSRTVPAPNRKPAGIVGARARIRSTAPGTVIVTSMARTPPAAMASTTACTLAGSFMRMTATTPARSMAAAVAARESRVLGSFMESLLASC